MSQNVSSPAVVIGALRVISYELIYCFVPEINYNNKNVLIFTTVENVELLVSSCLSMKTWQLV